MKIHHNGFWDKVGLGLAGATLLTGMGGDTVAKTVKGHQHSSPHRTHSPQHPVDSHLAGSHGQKVSQGLDPKKISSNNGHKPSHIKTDDFIHQLMTKQKLQEQQHQLDFQRDLATKLNTGINNFSRTHNQVIATISAIGLLASKTPLAPPTSPDDKALMEKIRTDVANGDNKSAFRDTVIYYVNGILQGRYPKLSAIISDADDKTGYQTALDMQKRQIGILTSQNTPMSPEAEETWMKNYQETFNKVADAHNLEVACAGGYALFAAQASPPQPTTPEDKRIVEKSLADRDKRDTNALNQDGMIYFANAIQEGKYPVFSPLMLKHMDSVEANSRVDASIDSSQPSRSDNSDSRDKEIAELKAKIQELEDKVNNKPVQSSGSSEDGAPPLQIPGVDVESLKSQEGKIIEKPDTPLDKALKHEYLQDLAKGDIEDAQRVQQEYWVNAIEEGKYPQLNAELNKINQNDYETGLEMLRETEKFSEQSNAEILNMMRGIMGGMSQFTQGLGQMFGQP